MPDSVYQVKSKNGKYTVGQEICRFSIDMVDIYQELEQWFDNWVKEWEAYFAREIDFDLDWIISNYALAYVEDPSNYLNPVGDVGDEINSTFHTGYWSKQGDDSFDRAGDELYLAAKHFVRKTIDLIQTRVFGSTNGTQCSKRDGIKWEMLTDWYGVLVFVAYEYKDRYDPYYHDNVTFSSLYRHNPSPEPPRTPSTYLGAVRRGQKALPFVPSILGFPQYNSF